MGFLLKWDTVTKTIPAEQAKWLSAGQISEMAKQEHVWSLHPQCPENVTYVGTRLTEYGKANDYYQDEAGVYWFESREITEPIATKFRYGGGKLCKKSTASAPAAGKNVMSA